MCESWLVCKKPSISILKNRKCDMKMSQAFFVLSDRVTNSYKCSTKLSELGDSKYGTLFYSRLGFFYKKIHKISASAPFVVLMFL